MPANRPLTTPSTRLKARPMGATPTSELKQELLDEGILSADSMLRLHDYLVMIERDEVEAYVEKYVGTIDEEAKLIKDTILRRDASLPDDGFFEHVSTIFLLP